ncbi:MAG TPA: hypothetical protein VNW23_02410 [Opitutaceae bacterium]|jgi:hypothetical protein|nr:hypothetical protein [Opitutaceae bacterium]
MKTRFIFASMALMLLGAAHDPLVAKTNNGESVAAWGACNVGANNDIGVQIQVDNSDDPANATSFILGSAGAPIANKADNIGFASGPAKLSGDCEIVVQVVKLSPGTQGWAAGGVMIRENYGAGAKFFAVGYTRGHGIQSFVRSANDAKVSPQEDCTDCKPPSWLKIVRRGNHFTSYKSRDGRAWLQVSELDVTMKKAVWAGVFVTSGGGQPIAQVTIDHVMTKQAGVPH